MRAHELSSWTETIEGIARERFGLDPWPMVVEVVPPATMIERIVFGGFPRRYAHWSYAMAAETATRRYRFGHFGSIDIVPNTNPAIVAVSTTDTPETAILRIAYAVAMSDFRHHNRYFLGSAPECAMAMMTERAYRLQAFRHDPAIGSTRVEEVLDAAHAIRYARSYPHSKARPSMLAVAAERFLHMEDWARETLRVVDSETEYLVPEIETRMLAEGWASFWALKIIRSMTDLSETMRDAIELSWARKTFRVPNIMRREWINHRSVGCRFFEFTERHGGTDELFSLRSQYRDSLVAEARFSSELGRKLGLVHIAPDPAGKSPLSAIVLDVSDDEGWEAVRKRLARQLGLGAWPKIEITDIRDRVAQQPKLYLRHRWDDRDLDETDTDQTLLCLRSIWPGIIVLETRLADSADSFFYVQVGGKIERGKATYDKIRPFLEH